MHNSTLNSIFNRTSLRKYKNVEIEENHLNLILESAMRAPTAGNMMMYSIIVVKDDRTKDLLSKTCDNQPFIATAPVILIFLADMHRLYKYFESCNIKDYCNKANVKFKTPNLSSLFLAAGDAFIAAQNTVIAAESLNIGSCYIGDIIENYEIHKKHFNLPDWTFPISMLCLGYYPDDYPKKITPRFDKKYIIHSEHYHDLNKDDFKTMYELYENKIPKPNKYNAENFGQFLYGRKFSQEFSNEMERSINVILKYWLKK